MHGKLLPWTAKSTARDYLGEREQYGGIVGRSGRHAASSNDSSSPRRPISPAWRVVRASAAFDPRDASTLVAASDNIYLFGDEDDVRTVVAHLPARSAHYRRLFRLDGTGLPELLVYSELFGHQKGAFRGACRDKPGMVWQMTHALLVIEHFDGLSPLLRNAICAFAETGEVRALGGTAAAGKVPAKVLLTGRQPAAQVGLRTKRLAASPI